MLLREAALVLTQGNGGSSYITCVYLRFSSLPPSLLGQQANAFYLNPGTGVLKGKSIRPESFTEGSKNVRHLPCYLSIQREPEFFSAYHH
jgi:hypothetical protein